MSYEEIFDASYERVKAIEIEGLGFFDAFYDNFLSSSELVAEFFVNTDMGKQKKILEKSFYSLFIFYATNNANDYLQKIALDHDKHNLNIEPELYDLWLENLMVTVKDYDPMFDHEVELSWRVVLAPGITYMKFHYDL